MRVLFALVCSCVNLARKSSRISWKAKLASNSVAWFALRFVNFPKSSFESLLVFGSPLPHFNLKLHTKQPADHQKKLNTQER